MSCNVLQEVGPAVAVEGFAMLEGLAGPAADSRHCTGSSCCSPDIGCCYSSLARPREAQGVGQGWWHLCRWCSRRQWLEQKTWSILLPAETVADRTNSTMQVSLLFQNP